MQVQSNVQISPALPLFGATNPFVSVAHIFTIACFLAAIFIAVGTAPALSLFPIAFLLGWTQVSTPCGGAIIGAFTSTAKPMGHWKRWATGLFFYSVAGLFSAVSIGVALGWLAHFFRDGFTHAVVLGILVGASLVLGAREAHLISFQLPERKRPSIQNFRDFGFNDAAAMWGMHIGLGFFTFMNYGGPYGLMLAILANVGGDHSIWFGSILMGCHWAGRAVSAWLAPAFTSGGPEGLTMLLQQVRMSFPAHQKVQMLGLLWLAGVGAYFLSRAVS